MNTLEALASHFDEYWNINDLMLVFSYMLYAVLDLIMQDPTSLIIKVLQCLIILSSFVKFIFFLRIFDGFSFLV